MIPLDTPLKGLPYAAIDCEATGYAGPDAHVVEVAVVHGVFGEDHVSVAYTSWVRPPVPIPESATQVHGITDADVAASPTWADVWPAVEEATKGRLPLGFMAPADHTFIATENARIGVPPLPFPWLCLLVVRRATKTRGRPGKLVEIAEEYGIGLDAHGATGDALSTALLVRPMMRAAWHAGAFGTDIRTVGDLFAWQRGAALAQERDWVRYRQREGDIARPRCPWHDLYGEPLPGWSAPTPKFGACPTCGASVLRRVSNAGQLVSVEAGSGHPHVCRS